MIKKEAPSRPRNTFEQSLDSFFSDLFESLGFVEQIGDNWKNYAEDQIGKAKQGKLGPDAKLVEQVAGKETITTLTTKEHSIVLRKDSSGKVISLLIRVKKGKTYGKS